MRNAGALVLGVTIGLMVGSPVVAHHADDAQKLRRRVTELQQSFEALEIYDSRLTKRLGRVEAAVEGLRARTTHLTAEGEYQGVIRNYNVQSYCSSGSPAVWRTVDGGQFTELTC